jgi:hypothetical protein
MRRMPWAVYCWPGLPQLYEGGSWAALAFAVAAAALLNATLLGSFVWDDLTAGQLRIICWTGLGVCWSVSAGYSAWSFKRQERLRSQDSVDLFPEALDFYLKGNWFEAQRALGRLIRRDRGDADARLMLAALLRHTRQFDEATRQLNVLARLEGADRWALEIRREGELLTAARKTATQSSNHGEQ